MCTIEEALKNHALSSMENIEGNRASSDDSIVNRTEANDLSTRIEEAVFDAELLLAHVLGRDRTYLKTWPEKLLNEQQLKTYLELIERRREGRPVCLLYTSQSPRD